jgi:hypothetical protein
MQDLGIDCDRLRVRRHIATPELPPILIAAGTVGILGFALLAAIEATSYIPITTGILSSGTVKVKVPK